jgi:GT2 family glycosyltransferase
MIPALPFDPETTASVLVSRLEPRTVLAAGRTLAPLAAALDRRGVDVLAVETLDDPPARCFDIVICDGASAEPASSLAVLLAALVAVRTSCLLLLSHSAEWPEAAASFGFAPDPGFDASLLAPGAVLYRRMEAAPPPAMVALSSEVLRLRRSLTARDAEFARQLGELREGFAAVSLALGARFDEQRRALDTVVARQHDVLEELLHSRIWRTLCSAGALVLKTAALGRRAGGAWRRVREIAGRETVRLALDEVSLDPNSSGSLYIRGWALARSGIERVEVEVDGAAFAAARTGLVRPDVAARFPHIAAAERAGFELTVSGLAPDSGAHSVRVRAVSRTGVAGEETHSFDPRRTPYDCWIAEYEQSDPVLVPLRLRCLPAPPLISVVMPVYQPDPRHLEHAIASVREQTYQQWELCLASDGPAPGEIADLLAAAVAADPRIRLTGLPARGGISSASNAALSLAHGEYVAFLDDDDELAPDALLLVAEAINRNPEAGFLYSDEDKISAIGHRYEPFFKPGWSPDLLLSENYVCHLLVARRDLVEAAGGLRSGFDGSQDHDLVLRLAERTGNIVHIPKVLYHWRAVDGSAALVSGAKPHAAGASCRAVEEHLERTGLAARVEPGAAEGRLRVRYAIPPGSRVSVIVPSGGNAGALTRCLESLHAKTSYRDYEVLVIDNSRGHRIARLVRSFAREGLAVRCLDWRDRPFNFSAMNNAAARECGTPLLLFLNDDTRVIDPAWLEALVELGARPGTGAVGAKLLYPDGRIQHAGIVMGVFHNCGHAFRGLTGDARHYFDFPDVIRNVSAVTGACMLVRASAFWEAGGFDEIRFPISFNDVDLCLRLGQRGYRILYTPHALLYHDESLSRRRRGMLLDPAGVRSLHAFWHDVIAGDPFYSPNLTCIAEDYSLRRRANAF